MLKHISFCQISGSNPFICAAFLSLCCCNTINTSLQISFNFRPDLNVVRLINIGGSFIDPWQHTILLPQLQVIETSQESCFSNIFLSIVCAKVLCQWNSSQYVIATANTSK